MMIKKFRLWTLSLILVLLSSVAIADDSPLPLLQGISSSMLSQLSKLQSQLASNPSIISNMVNELLIPHVDVDRMAGSVLGRNYWQGATPEQRSQFVSEFSHLVISTYSSALSSYDHDQIKFYPIRGGVSGSQSVQLNSVIIRQSGQTVSVNYNLERSGSDWKIYDFVIDNVSMVQSYRSQFASTLTQGGLPALLQKLQARQGS